MHNKKKISAICKEMVKYCSSKKKKTINMDRKYEYFKRVINETPVVKDHQMIRMYKCRCKLGTVEGFEDVSLNDTAIKKLINKYNTDSESKYYITVTKEPNKKTRHYLNFKETNTNTNIQNTNKCIDINTLVKDSESSKINRDEWCINWVINSILNKFKDDGFGGRFKAKDLIGKNHPFCERTLYCITNHHVAEARRKINSNKAKYGFCISPKYVMCPVTEYDNNIGW